GGNVFIFFGAALLLGSPTAVIATAIYIPLMDLFIRREERQLERVFGEEGQRYKKRVSRRLFARNHAVRRFLSMSSVESASALIDERINELEAGRLAPSQRQRARVGT